MHKIHYQLESGPGKEISAKNIMKALSMLSVVYQQYYFYEDQVMSHKLVRTGQQGSGREGSGSVQPTLWGVWGSPVVGFIPYWWLDLLASCSPCEWWRRASQTAFLLCSQGIRETCPAFRIPAPKKHGGPMPGGRPQDLKAEIAPLSHLHQNVQPWLPGLAHPVRHRVLSWSFLGCFESSHGVQPGSQ